MESKIKKSYLMWIGSESYKTIQEWAEEAVVQGISKRLPNADVGQALTEPGTVIFIAHDEGEFHDCPECMGIIANPERRLVRTQIRNLRNEIDDMEALLEKIEEEIDNDKSKNVEKDKKEAARLEKLILKRRAKMMNLEATLNTLPEVIEAGTGGSVKVNIPNIKKAHVWDYRKYNYRLHQPKRYTFDVVEKDMCENCGGTGLLPDAKVFGLFVPSAIEYILKEEDTKKVKDEMEKERGFRTVSTKKVLVEQRRKCGLRKPGGVYVVTDATEKTSKNAKSVVKQLIDEGVVEPAGVEINGNFIRFVEPIDVNVKRFRGIKSWNLDPKAEDEAEMILDALEE